MKKCNPCNNVQSTCDQSVSLPLPIISPLENDWKSDCWTCWWLNTQWGLENGFEARLQSRLAKDSLPTFDDEWNPTLCIRISELPYSSRGLMTLSDWNSAETIEYTYDKWTTVQIWEDWIQRCFLNNIPWNPWEVCILKRGIHPAAMNLLVDWEGWNTAIVELDWSANLTNYNWCDTDWINSNQKEVAPDYNNCDFMFEHLPGSTVRRWTYAQEHSIFLQHTCCVCATDKRAGIVRLSKESTSSACAVVITNDDFANCSINWVDNPWIVRGTTKCVPEWEEYVVSWNDYATSDHAWLVKISNVQSLDCNTGTISTREPDCIIPETAMNVDQHAFPWIYWSVQLSRCIDWSIAVSKNDNATCDNNWLTQLKPLKDGHLCPNIPSDIWICGNIDIPTRVVQEFDYADDDHYGLVRLSRALNSDLQCPVVVTKHDNATCINNWLVTLKTLKQNHICPDIPDDIWVCWDIDDATWVVQEWDLADFDHYGLVKLSKELDDDLMCPVVVTKHDWSDHDNLWITLQSVNTEDCDVLNTDKPTEKTPIATSTNDKRNFHQVACAMENYTSQTSWWVLVPAWESWTFGIDNMTVEENTTGNMWDINDWSFYCYDSLNQWWNGFVIDQDWWYDLSFIIKWRNTKTQLDGTDPNASFVRHTGRIDIDGNNSEIWDIIEIPTTVWDAGYSWSDPRYWGDPVRTWIINNSWKRFLTAWQVITLRRATDPNTPAYLLYTELCVEMIQPNL